jgi:hypothetical protein
MLSFLVTVNRVYSTSTSAGPTELITILYEQRESKAQERLRKECATGCAYVIP